MFNLITLVIFLSVTTSSGFIENHATRSQYAALQKRVGKIDITLTQEQWRKNFAPDYNFALESETCRDVMCNHYIDFTLECGTGLYLVDVTYNPQNRQFTMTPSHLLSPDIDQLRHIIGCLELEDWSDRYCVCGFEADCDDASVFVSSLDTGYRSGFPGLYSAPSDTEDFTDLKTRLLAYYTGMWHWFISR
jgi:hypothetical protein